jgi:dihydrofolate reductase
MAAVPHFKIVYACTPNRGIGKGGTIPWYYPEDVKFFRSITQHSVVIMGRQTWDSIPASNRPLVGRINIVISSNTVAGPQFSVGSLEIALSIASNVRNGRDVFIIGGRSIYGHCMKMDQCEHIYETRVPSEYGCDIYIPCVDMDRFDLITTTNGRDGLQFLHFRNKNAVTP